MSSRRAGSTVGDIIVKHLFLQQAEAFSAPVSKRAAVLLLCDCSAPLQVNVADRQVNRATPSAPTDELAQALVYEAFSRLQQHGVDVATVGTGSWNTATMSQVEAVGFRLTSRVLAYARTFR